MTERELEIAVANLSPRRHALYQAIHDHGPLTVREIMEREVGGPAKKASLSDLLRPLRAEGLITSAGLRNVGRHLAVLCGPPTPPGHSSTRPSRSMSRT